MSVRGLIQLIGALYNALMISGIFKKNTNPLKLAIENAAREHDLSPDLIAAIVLKESSGNQFATRYEPNFYRQYLANRTTSQIPAWYKSDLCSLDTERTHRATSFGLMQVIGQTAREHGFKGDFFTELCNIETGLYWGCTVLKTKLASTKSFRKGIERYNGSGPRAEAYAEAIIRSIQSKSFEVLFL